MKVCDLAEIFIGVPISRYKYDLVDDTQYFDTNEELNLPSKHRIVKGKRRQINVTI